MIYALKLLWWNTQKKQITVKKHKFAFKLFNNPAKIDTL
jgi:hypothetical protein